jgi:hypothetical protein
MNFQTLEPAPAAFPNIGTFSSKVWKAQSQPVLK